jgi:hypothetical protein
MPGSAGVSGRHPGRPARVDAFGPTEPKRRIGGEARAEDRDRVEALHLQHGRDPVEIVTCAIEIETTSLQPEARR